MFCEQGARTRPPGAVLHLSRWERQSKEGNGGAVLIRVSLARFEGFC